MTTPTSATAPSRTFSSGTDDDVVGEDTSEVTKLFHERLQAWKHAVGYLEEYITATEKANHAHGKEYEKVLKSVKDPLKEAHHFDQAVGGIGGLFENIRTNTQGLYNSYYETQKQLKTSILPIFERLHTEIKNKSKELTKGAGKGSKAVDKARATTQKHIEMLGQYTASFDSAGAKLTASEDPYVLRRAVLHRLNKQIQEENNNRQDLISVQNSFAQFEAHVIQTIQHGMGQFMQVVSAQAENTKQMYGDMVGTAQRIPLDFEWNGFIQRNTHILIDPSSPARSISNVSFPNQDHRATKPLIAGSLERKGKIMRSYETNYYVVTPAKFLHEYKTDDDFAKDPTPEMSLYLPDCIIGGCNDRKFNVKGKDVSKGKVGNTFSMNHEIQFKAHTSQAANQWWEIIRQVAGQISGELPESSVPTSPTDSKSSAGAQPLSPITTEKQVAPIQTQGLPTRTGTGMTAGTAGTTGTSGSGPLSAAPASGVEGKPGDY